MKIDRMTSGITTKKSIYVAPHSEVITLNVGGDIMEGAMTITSPLKQRTKMGESWAKKYNWEPVAPDLGNISSDNEWDHQTHTQKIKSVWDD